MNLIVRVYSKLLHLYPRSYRNEFAEEMQAVFTDALRETAQLGKVAVLSLCIRELCDSTVCILREQLRNPLLQPCHRLPRQMLFLLRLFLPMREFSPDLDWLLGELHYHRPYPAFNGPLYP